MDTVGLSTLTPQQRLLTLQFLYKVSFCIMLFYCPRLKTFKLKGIQELMLIFFYYNGQFGVFFVCFVLFFFNFFIHNFSAACPPAFFGFIYRRIVDVNRPVWNSIEMQRIYTDVDDSCYFWFYMCVWCGMD